eukprot:g6364.t1
MEQRERATVEGYLVKRSIRGLASTWKRRWFQLRGNTLYYYKHEDDDPAEFRGCLVLSDSSAVKLKNSNMDSPLPVSAPSHAAREHWVRVLSDTIEQLKRAAQYVDARADSDGEAAVALRKQRLSERKAEERERMRCQQVISDARASELQGIFFTAVVGLGLILLSPNFRCQKTTVEISALVTEETSTTSTAAPGIVLSSVLDDVETTISTLTLEPMHFLEHFLVLTETIRIDLVSNGMVFFGIFLLLLSTAAAFYPWAANFVWKMQLCLRGQLHLFLSNESRGLSSVPDADRLLVHLKSSCEKENVPVEQAMKSLRSKTIVFIRHGESRWNEIFNKGSGCAKLPMLLFRFFRGLFWEFCMFTKRDSIFYDSPLSSEGVEQAKILRNFLKLRKLNENRDKKKVPEDDQHKEISVDRVIAALKGSNSKSLSDSVIVSSNLRRSIATIGISLYDRLSSSRERVVLHSSLQEMSRNVDTLATAGTFGCVPDMPVLRSEFDKMGGRLMGTSSHLMHLCDPSENKGNKSIRRTGLADLKEFAAWCMARPEEIISVGGHSLWWRAFFRTLLPKSTEHPANKKKI